MHEASFQVFPVIRVSLKCSGFARQRYESTGQQRFQQLERSVRENDPGHLRDASRDIDRISVGGRFVDASQGDVRKDRHQDDDGAYKSVDPIAHRRRFSVRKGHGTRD